MMKIYEKSLNEMKKSLLAIPNRPLILKSKKRSARLFKTLLKMVIKPFATMSANLITSIWQIFQFPPFSLIKRWMRSMMTCG